MTTSCTYSYICVSLASNRISCNVLLHSCVLGGVRLAGWLIGLMWCSGREEPLVGWMEAREGERERWRDRMMEGSVSWEIES